MSFLVLQLQGRFGNQVLQYLFARAFAERCGLTLVVDPWIGERIFQITSPRVEPCMRGLPRFNEVTIFDKGMVALAPDLEFRGYAQRQECMIYTKRQAQEWLKLRPEIETACVAAVGAAGGSTDRIVCHQRKGDYAGYGFPMVSVGSYRQAAADFGLEWHEKHVAFLTEEAPTPHAGFLPDDLSFMPDFYRMMKAPTLLRGNSTFSWLAALLGNGLVLSPIIEGLRGGCQHNCRFVAGNWPRFANLDFVTDLFVNDR